MGDVVITLPYLQRLRDKFPQAQFDFLTRKEVDDIPRKLDLFDRVFSIGGGRNFKRQVLGAILLLPQLWWQHYDVVIDLQQSELSRWIRKLLSPPSWSEFDRSSPLSAGERTRLTVDILGLGSVDLSQKPKLRNPSLGLEILRAAGWSPGFDLIVLNPAGGFRTKNWPLENYVDFARLWLNKTDQDTQFLVLGVEAILTKAQFLKEQLGDRLMNLVNQTTPSEAFSMIQKVDLVLSEDSGLMHMAWVSGIPTLALFGASRSDRSSPLGDFSLCSSSADLSCGECMKEICQFGDVRCLTRYTPQLVFEKARGLLKR